MHSNACQDPILSSLVEQPASQPNRLQTAEALKADLERLGAVVEDFDFTDPNPWIAACFGDQELLVMTLFMTESVLRDFDGRTLARLPTTQARLLAQQAHAHATADTGRRRF